jgi:hypothetical protein
MGTLDLTASWDDRRMTKHHFHLEGSQANRLFDDELREIAEAALAQRRPAAVLPLTPRAVFMATKRDSPAELLAETRFVLAQALWLAPLGRGRDRERAMTLAQEARDAFREIGSDRAWAGELAEVEKWIREHGDPSK